MCNSINSNFLLINSLFVHFAFKNVLSQALVVTSCMHSMLSSDVTVLQNFIFNSLCVLLDRFGASLVAQLVKTPAAMWETWFRSLGWEDLLEKGKATHSDLENSRDCIVHGVTKSSTWLSNFHFHFRKICFNLSLLHTLATLYLPLSSFFWHLFTFIYIFKATHHSCIQG